MAVFTDSGVTLFDRTPRSVTFSSTANFSAATQGQAVYADGVPITAQGSPLSIHTGRLAGLVSVRDNLGVTYQKQLDEIARGLITNFQETDQSATPTQPAQAGLFTNGGSLTVPPAGVCHSWSRLNHPGCCDKRSSQRVILNCYGMAAYRAMGERLMSTIPHRAKLVIQIG